MPSKLTITKLVMMISTNLAEDDVLAIEPLGLGGAEEELGPVGVGPSVGHGEDTFEKRKGLFYKTEKCKTKCPVWAMEKTP